eukprot:403353215
MERLNNSTLKFEDFVEVTPEYQTQLQRMKISTDKYQLRGQRQEILTLSKMFPCVSLFGVTGQGKSTTANTLIGESGYFKVSASIESETTQCKGVVRNWYGDEKQTQLLVLDTPGIGDSMSRDTNHITNMVQRLKCVGYVNTFLIALSSQEPRFNELLKQSFMIFQEMFGDEFFKNVLLCFTRFAHDKRSLRQRTGKNQKQLSDLKSDQFVFIDNINLDDDDEFGYEDLEITQFQVAKDAIKAFTLNREVFICQDIKEVQKENDKIKQELEEQKKKHEEEKKRLALEQERKLKLQKEESLRKQKEMEETHRKEQLKIQKEKQEQEERARKEKQRLQEENERLERRLNQSSYSSSFYQPSYSSFLGGGYGGCGGGSYSGYGGVSSSGQSTTSQSSQSSSGKLMIDGRECARLTAKGLPDMRYTINKQNFGKK